MVRGRIEPRAHALSPIPTPACNADFITPDDFAHLRRFNDRSTVFHGVEAFASSCNGQARLTRISGQIFASDRHCILHAYGIVQINQRIEPGQRSVFQKTLSEGVGRARGSLRFDAKAFVDLGPGFQMSLCPCRLCAFHHRTCLLDCSVCHRSIDEITGFDDYAHGTEVGCHGENVAVN